MRIIYFIQLIAAIPMDLNSGIMSQWFSMLANGNNKNFLLSAAKLKNSNPETFESLRRKLGITERQLLEIEVTSKILSNVLEFTEIKRELGETDYSLKTNSYENLMQSSRIMESEIFRLEEASNTKDGNQDAVEIKEEIKERIDTLSQEIKNKNNASRRTAAGVSSLDLILGETKPRTTAKTKGTVVEIEAPIRRHFKYSFNNMLMEQSEPKLAEAKPAEAKPAKPAEAKPRPI
eukprot:NODE_113_length_19319_cov_0.247815.p8 type:complete len:234 gc:universal NODE_113_length_19319_cov_0.247815:10618-9917(-)